VRLLQENAKKKSKRSRRPWVLKKQEAVKKAARKRRVKRVMEGHIASIDLIVAPIDISLKNGNRFLRGNMRGDVAP